MRSRVVTLLLAGNRVSADALKADFLAMYTEVKIQVPSLSLLLAPRWNGRQGYQDGISPLLHYASPASIASISSYPSWLKCLQHGQVTSSHIASHVVQFYMNTMLLWLVLH